MSSIREVAKLAKVSTATVSRYLNNPNTVKKTTKDNIRKVIEEINYIPNAHAKVVFGGSSYSLGIMVPSLDNPFYAELTLHLEMYASKFGYKTILCNTLYDSKNEKLHLNQLLENRVDGIIVIETTNKLFYKDIKIPIVGMGNKIRESSPIILADDYKGGKVAFEHLNENNPEKLLFVTNDADTTFLNLVKDGFEENASIKDVLVDTLIVPNKADGQIDFAHFIGIENYDGIFVYTDMVALRIIQYIEGETQKKIGKDIMLVGYGDIVFSKISNPALTSISQSKKELSKEAIDTIISLINGKETKQETITDIEIKIRKSSRRI